MNFYILTLFPDMVEQALGHSMLKRAAQAGLISVTCLNIRDFAGNRHGQVDDYPYGGGAGLVMQPWPVYRACLRAKELAGGGARVVYMTPQGEPFTQKRARRLAEEKNLILLCGHYEGVDERVIEEIVTDQLSIGDYVLTGGELAAMVVVDCVARLVPGVLGGAGSNVDESFENGLLEYPQYTRPPEFLGRKVPDVLLSGHHGNVAAWRAEQSLGRTRARRPDLLAGMEKEVVDEKEGEEGEHGLY